MMLLAGDGRLFGPTSPGNWLFYLQQIPRYYLGWGGAIFWAVGVVTLVGGRRPGGTALWVAWTAVFYLFFSLVGYKTPRLAMFWMPGLAWTAGVGMKRLADEVGRAGRVLVGAAAVAALIGGAYGGYLILPEYTTTARTAAARALAYAPERMLYVGGGNGSFIFRVRELAGRERPRVVRASKTFYLDNIQSELGGKDVVATVDETRRLMAAISPDIVVRERNDSGLLSLRPAVRALETYLATNDFDPVEEILDGEPPRPVMDVLFYLGPRQPTVVDVELPGVAIKLELGAEGE
jgi:hypothetical protein